MVQNSLQKSSNTVITKKIKNAFVNSMNVLFRDYSKSVSYEAVPTRYDMVFTGKMPAVTIELYSLKRNRVLFYSERIFSYGIDDASKVSLKEIEDTTNSYRHQKVENEYLFKTPQVGIITTGEPETKFVKSLLKEDIAKKIDSFIKSTDTNFYHFEYSWKKGSHAR